jgi:hypothetical protein
MERDFVLLITTRRELRKKGGEAEIGSEELRGRM